MITGEADRDRIAAAVRAAEAGHRGEIVVHLEPRPLVHPLRRAARLFHQLGVDRTKDGTGVLLYVAPTARRAAVWAGPGIVGGDDPETWAPVFAALGAGSGAFDLTRLCAAIAALGQVLAQRAAGVDHHGDELGNEVRA